nr:hypothetical protein CFP56_00628 [Quercus suber]
MIAAAQNRSSFKGDGDALSSAHQPILFSSILDFLTALPFPHLSYHSTLYTHCYVILPFLYGERSLDRLAFTFLCLFLFEICNQGPCRSKNHQTSSLDHLFLNPNPKLSIGFAFTACQIQPYRSTGRPVFLSPSAEASMIPRRVREMRDGGSLFTSASLIQKRQGRSRIYRSAHFASEWGFGGNGVEPAFGMKTSLSDLPFRRNLLW